MHGYRFHAQDQDRLTAGDRLRAKEVAASSPGAARPNRDALVDGLPGGGRQGPGGTAGGGAAGGLVAGGPPLRGAAAPPVQAEGRRRAAAAPARAARRRADGARAGAAQPRLAAVPPGNLAEAEAARLEAADEGVAGRRWRT